MHFAISDGKYIVVNKAKMYSVSQMRAKLDKRIPTQSKSI